MIIHKEELLRFRDIITPYYPLLRKYPKSISITVNSVCNLRCEMCDIGRKNKKSKFYRSMVSRKEMTLKKLEEIAEEIKNNNTKVHINSLEPLLYDKIGDAIKAFTSRGIKCTLTTNGYLLSSKMEELISSGLDELIISIDALGKSHDEIRGMPGLYDTVTRSIKEIRKKNEKIKIRVSICIMPKNYENLLRIIMGLNELKIDSVIVAHYNYITKDMSEKDGRGIPSSSLNKVKLDEINTKILAQEIKKIKEKYKSFVNFIPDINDKEIYDYYKIL